jgi:TPR repeat protein
MRAGIVALCLLLVGIGPAWAGFNKGLEAYGRGDYATALDEWRLLAERGNTLAQLNIGYMYHHGRGVPQDYPEAVKWYRRAAEQGYALAQYNLGIMYYQGRGVGKDYVRAHMWFNLASASGMIENAGTNRDTLEKKMTPHQVAEARKLANEWLENHREDE